MKEYSIIDKRKRSTLVLSKAIPLAYGPHIGSDAVYLYLLYVSMSDQGNVPIEDEDIKEFMSIDSESLEKCNQTLEEYGLIKLEDHEHDGRVVTNCYVLQPPPLPQTLYQNLRKRSLAKHIEDILDIVPPEAPQKKTRAKRQLITATKLINNFYKALGNGKVDIFERESAKQHISDLLQDGYSLEDIDFAIDWGFEFARDEVEDFSSIANFIERAVAAREEHLANRSQRAEEEAKSQEEEEIERKIVAAYRKMMPEAEQKRLRERVMQEIRQDKRINEEFVTEQLIVIKENEIIRKEYLKRGATAG